MGYLDLSKKQLILGFTAGIAAGIGTVAGVDLTKEGMQIFIVDRICAGVKPEDGIHLFNFCTGIWLIIPVLISIYSAISWFSDNDWGKTPSTESMTWFLGAVFGWILILAPQPFSFIILIGYVAYFFYNW